MRIIDKIDKIGEEAVKEEIAKLEVPNEDIEKIINFIKIDGTSDEKISKLQNLGIDNETYKKGVEELAEVIKNIRSYFVRDVSNI